MLSSADGDLVAEIQKLRKENARLLMEREAFKKRQRSLRRSSREVCLHQRDSFLVFDPVCRVL